MWRERGRLIKKKRGEKASRKRSIKRGGGGESRRSGRTKEKIN